MCGIELKERQGYDGPCALFVWSPLRCGRELVRRYIRDGSLFWENSAGEPGAAELAVSVGGVQHSAIPAKGEYLPTIPKRAPAARRGAAGANPLPRPHL